ncbi:MAG: FtsH protease activity modulator HflK [Gammaproteobacteria bacterium]|nr:FtsH protease activity modulator HflK [Gammaproteobacteria bacterium]
MAWNQPDGKKDPWGRRPGQGGSDLEQTVRDWQHRLESMFRSGGGEPGQGRGALGWVVAAVVALLWAASGFYQVNAPDRGVIQRFGRLVEVREPGWGWRWPWPIETVTMVNVSNVNSVEYKSRVLTADVNLVDLQVAVQFQYADPVKVLFSVREPEETIREVSESAIREVVGRSQLDSILVGATRPEITARTRELIQKTLEFYGAGVRVSSVNLTDVQVPEAVIPSQRDANKALADQERLVKEAEAYASGILPVAEGAASRQIQEAQGYKAQVVALAHGESSRFAQLVDAYQRAPEVTRQRMYIETVEGVLGRARKVVLDSAAGGKGGNVLYLPLDKLMERQNAGARSTEEAAAPAQRPAADAEAAAPDPRSRPER